MVSCLSPCLLRMAPIYRFLNMVHLSIIPCWVGMIQCLSSPSPLLVATSWYAVGPAGGGAVLYAPHLRFRCITLVTHLLTFGSYCRYIIRHPSLYLLTSRHLTPNCSYVTSNSPSRLTCHLPRPLYATFHAPILVTSHVTFTPPFSRLPRHLSRHFPRHPSRHLLCHFRSRHHFRHHSHCHPLCHLLDTFYATFIDTIYIKTTYYVTSQVTS